MGTAGLSLAILLTPLGVATVISFSAEAFPTFPPRSFSLGWYQEFAATSMWMDALRTSAQIAVPAGLLATVLGTFAAFGLVRADYPARARSWRCCCPR